MSTATIATVNSHSGRKAARTDYVYVVAMHVGTGVTIVDTTRTLKSARESVRSFDGSPSRTTLKIRKIGRNTWMSTDGVASYAIGLETFYTIQRKPLHN